MIFKKVNFITLYISVYFILYILPFPFYRIPTIYENTIVWFGKTILGLDFIRQVTTGSGDTIFDYVEIVLLLLMTFLVSIIILFFNESIRNKIIIFSITYSRYFLVFMLFTYGFYKFGSGQFPTPSLFRLEQKVGDMSPMGMLFVFMGSSKMYAVFSAVCQLISGFMLLYKRTVVLGALLAFGVMLNISVLNFSYDVPLKLLSTHLALISLFIIHKNFKAIFVFFSGYPSQITFYTLNFKSKQLKIILKTLILSYILYLTLISSLFRIFSSKQSATKEIDGIYSLELAPIVKDSLYSDFKWKKIIIDIGYAKIYSETDTLWYSDVILDKDKKTILFKAYDTTLTDVKVNFEFDIDNKLELIEIGGYKKRIGKFNKTTNTDYELIKHNFNWTNEFPYNK
jgi:hypothetical protein